MQDPDYRLTTKTWANIQGGTVPSPTYGLEYRLANNDTTTELELPCANMPVPCLARQGSWSYRATGEYTQVYDVPETPTTQTLEIRVRDGSNVGTELALFSFAGVPAISGTARVRVIINMDVIGVLNGTHAQLWSCELLIYEPTAPTVVVNATRAYDYSEADITVDHLFVPTVKKTVAMAVNALTMRSFVGKMEGESD